MNKKLKILRYHLLKNVFRTKRDVPIYIFGYHKCGTKLLGKVFLQMALKYGWEYKSIPGSVNEMPNADVVFFLHSQVDYNKLPEKFIGIHMVRDPRDIIISGYLYHKRTIEEWCINENFQTEDPIVYNALEEEDAIIFEMNHYGKWTIEDMLKWDFEKANCLELKFEDVMSNYDDEMMKIFKHCNFSPAQIKMAKHFADKEDLNKMSKKDIEKHPHISSVKTKKWERYFTEKLQRYFDTHFSEVLKKYNY